MLGRGRGGCQPALPPPLRPAGSLRNPKRGQAPCQGGGVPGPPRASSCQPRWCPCAGHGRTRFPPTATGTGWLPWQDPELECKRASARGEAPCCPCRCWNCRGQAWGSFPKGLEEGLAPSRGVDCKTVSIPGHASSHSLRNSRRGSTSDHTPATHWGDSGRNSVFTTPPAPSLWSSGQG